MKYDKLLILLVLFTMISGCSFIQEDKTIVPFSSDGKLDSIAEDDKSEETEDIDEPPEPEISNPMPVREMSAPEMPIPEMSAPEMLAPEMPLRDN